MSDHAPASADTDGVRIRGDSYTAEAGWFGPGGRPRFGWLYTPERPAANGVGIVIVPPFGFEAICAHRALRHLAEDSARAGFFALRFDLDGSGDSLGDDTDPDRVEAWQASIHDACDLVRNAGAMQLILAGVRLGAALAALAASSRKDIAALIAINGVVRGRDFLREARALQAAMGLRPSPAPLPDDGSQEVNGFVITAETRTQLGDIDLNQCSAPPAPRALLIERNDMPERKHWPEHLRTLGTEVEVQRLQGLAKMLDLPHLAEVPRDAIGACIDYAQRMGVDTALADAEPHAVTIQPEIRIATCDSIVIEQIVRIDGALLGILARPVPCAPGLGVVLLNAGAVPRIGPNRMYVAWARHWAARGCWVLRADLSGIGDSIVRSGAMENHVYGEHGIADTASFAAWLKQHGATCVVACGNCSGAYHALQAAIGNQAIDTVVLINPGALQYIGVVSNLATELNNDSYYNNQLRGGRGLRKLMHGRISSRKLLRVVCWYASTYTGLWWRELLRMLHWPMRNDLGAALRVFARRGGVMHVVFSADDRSRALLAVQAGSAKKRLVKQGHLQLRVIDGPDHTFTQRWAQARLHDVLMAILIPRSHHGL